jgi:hypothetical protein
MAALLFLAVCSYLFTLVASNPVAPVITPQAVLPRQQDGEGPPPDFIAWVPSTFNSTSTFYEPLSCGMAGGGSSWTFATTTVFESTFVQCCNTGRSSLSDCYSSFFTACSSSKTAYYSDTSIVWYALLPICRRLNFAKLPYIAHLCATRTLYGDTARLMLLACIGLAVIRPHKQPIGRRYLLVP